MRSTGGANRSSGPVGWRSPHHGYPEREFELLCDEAERRGLIVSLTVGARTFGNPERKFRLLGAISVGRARGARLFSIPVIETVAHAAVRARATLASA